MKTRPPEDVVMRALRAGLRVELHGYTVVMGVDTNTGIEEPVIVAQRYTLGSESDAQEVGCELDHRTFVRMCRDLDAETLVGIAASTVLREMANESIARREAYHATRAARRVRSWTITNMAGDCSSACTVEAPGRPEALQAFAREQGYPTLQAYLIDRGLSLSDLAVHEDED